MRNTANIKHLHQWYSYLVDKTSEYQNKVYIVQLQSNQRNGVHWNYIAKSPFLQQQKAR